ncbi:MAG: hypothetical protein P4L81_04415 [Candidatus Pacebacteria bacterium]|nr:hypothetical protein [Candidatus Paceibacterota bacterium]
MTPELRSQQRILHTHRILLRAGFSLVSTFAWIFVFVFALTFSGSIASAFFVSLVVYALSQIVVIIATPLSAAHLRHGLRRSMVFGALLSALAFAALGATMAGYFASPLGWGLALFGILLGSYRALYWIPYRLQSAGQSKKTALYYEILLALLPAFAGVTLISVNLSVFRLLFGAAGLMLLSVIPIFFLEDLGEPFRWGYVETFTKLFEERYQTLALRSVLWGMESVTLMLLWPLTVFLIVGRSYFVFGLIMSVSLLVLLALRKTYRDALRIWDVRDSMPLEIAVAVSGWILRLIAGSPLMIVVADSYSFVSAPASVAEFVSREHAADGGSYIDEYTALQEIGMGLGRLLMCVFAGALLFTMPVSVVLALSLIVAAVVAGAAAYFSHKIRLEAY